MHRPVYLYSAFHKMHRFKAASEKIIMLYTIFKSPCRI